MSRATDLHLVDELMLRLVRSVRRPAYRNRILEGVSRIPGADALRVLRSVELRESGGEPASIRDVAGDLEVEQSTASRAVNAVVDLRLVDRTVDEADARRTRLTLTDDGRTALARATENRRGVIAEVTADWPAADVREFSRLLALFVARYEGVAGAPLP